MKLKSNLMKVRRCGQVGCRSGASTLVWPKTEDSELFACQPPIVYLNEIDQYTKSLFIPMKYLPISAGIDRQ